MGQCLSMKKQTRISNRLQRSLTLSRLNSVVTDYYDLRGTIGSGSMGSVYFCSRKPRDDNSSLNDTIEGASIGSHSNRGGRRERYAVKAMNKELLEAKMDVTIKEIRLEIDCLKELDHPYIVKCIETFDNPYNIFIVMDLCQGGDLYSRQPYTESRAAVIVSQLQSALTYMHKRNVIHRDLKFENILFENTEEESPVKIIDFGLATKAHVGKPSAMGTVGTVYTMAPEVLNNEAYSTKADIWSLGICTYMLLVGKNPVQCYRDSFREARKVKYTLDKIKSGNISFQEDQWNLISPEAKHLVKNLLMLNPELRPSALEISSSQWLQDQHVYSGIVYDQQELENIKSSLKSYAEASALKKIGWMIIAHSMQNTDHKFSEIRKMFQKFDIENNGILSKEEFRLALGSVYTESEVSEVYDILDVEKDGTIHYTEWLAAMMEDNITVKKDSLLHAFNVIDSDNSGVISIKNLQFILGNGYSKDVLKNMISEVDSNGHGVITKHQFIALFSDNRLKKKSISNSKLASQSVARRQCPIAVES